MIIENDDLIIEIDSFYSLNEYLRKNFTILNNSNTLINDNILINYSGFKIIFNNRKLKNITWNFFRYIEEKEHHNFVSPFMILHLKEEEDKYNQNCLSNMIFQQEVDKILEEQRKEEIERYFR